MTLEVGGSQSGLYRSTLAGAKGQGALEMGLSELGVRLFAIEVTLDQASRNWSHFIKSTRRIENLLTLK
jgi:hypothetical protein